MINILLPKLLFFLETTKKIERNLQLISKLLQKTVNYKLLFSDGLIPHNMAKGFDAPPTLERSGSEHRRAVTSSLFGQERGLVRKVEPSLTVRKVSVPRKRGNRRGCKDH